MKAPVNAVKDEDIPEKLPGAPALNGSFEGESVSKRKHANCWQRNKTHKVYIKKASVHPSSSVVQL